MKISDLCGRHRASSNLGVKKGMNSLCGFSQLTPIFLLDELVSWLIFVDITIAQQTVSSIRWEEKLICADEILPGADSTLIPTPALNLTPTNADKVRGALGPESGQ